MTALPSDCRSFKPATRERVRRAIAVTIEELVRTGDPRAITVAKVRGAGSGDSNATTALLRAWRGGLSVFEPWDDVPEAGAAPKRDELVEAIAGATTREAIGEVARKVAAKVAANELDAAAGRVILEALERQAPAAGSSAAAPVDAGLGNELDAIDLESQRGVLATDEGLEVAEAFDLMVSGERRARVMEFVQRELADDIEEHPNTDSGGAAARRTG